MTSRIRFNDVTAAYHELRAEIDAAVAAVLARGDFINGAAVRAFEEEFARYCGAAHCVGTANGTASLHLALRAAGIGPGDEVVTTPMTFIATAEAITQAGAAVVFADICPGTLNLDPRAVEAALTPRTRAVIFVHLHGNPSGLRAVADVAARHGLVLIEDAAQAHGALVAHGGTMAHAGTIGNAGTFSFFPAKNLGAFGDAGAIVTSDAAIAARAKRLANHGREEKYVHAEEGFNYRLDTLQAAILSAKLPRLNEHTARRNAIAAIYEDRLGTLGLRFQQREPDVRHARHLFVVQTARRDALQLHLAARGIETGIHYPLPLHLQPAYARLKLGPGAFPQAEQYARESLSLPLYPQMEDGAAGRVCEAVASFFAA